MKSNGVFRKETERNIFLVNERKLVNEKLW